MMCSYKKAVEVMRVVAWDDGRESTNPFFLNTSRRRKTFIVCSACSVFRSVTMTLTPTPPDHTSPVVFSQDPPCVRHVKPRHVLASTSVVGVIGCGVVGEQVALDLARVYERVLVFDTTEDAMARVVTNVVTRKGCVVQAAANLVSIAQACHTLFLALPTPALVTNEGGGHDVSAIESVLAFLHTFAFRGPVLLRSTLCPGTTDRLAAVYTALHLFHVPEFLSSRTAHLDTALPLQPLVLLGVPDGTPAALVDRVRTLLEAVSCGRQRVTTVRAKESEATKLFCNAFYTTKLQLFNEFYQVTQREGVSYDMVRHLMLQQGWVHPMHTQVPGPDGQLGVGGACLPKDAKALAGHVAGFDGAKTSPLLRALGQI